MCLNKTTLHKEMHDVDFIIHVYSRLAAMEADRFIILEGDTVSVTNIGKLFIRNICAAFDAYLFKKELQGQTFSKAI